MPGFCAPKILWLARHEPDAIARTRRILLAKDYVRLRLSGDSVWTEERLKQFVRLRFGEQAIYVVSNREPLSHVYDGKDMTNVPAFRTNRVWLIGSGDVFVGASPRPPVLAGRQ